MKLNRTYLLITLSSLALLAVLIIQVKWILQTAKIKEDLFNEKANMVLSRTAEALGEDKVMCGQIKARVEENRNPGPEEIRKLDSLLNHYMRFYNFHIDYSYKLMKPGPLAVGAASAKNENGWSNAFFPSQAGSYKKSLEEVVSEKGLELKLIFPDKTHFIIAEMGPLFITSVILILVVLVLFWRTVLSLLREKKISEHTTDFLNNMTHEFKTPLTNIALAGRMIMKDSAHRQEDRITHYSGIILEENDKLRLQVEQVLSMTALERGEIPLQKTELDFHELICQSIKCMQVQVDNRQGNLVLNLDAEQVVVTGDKTHLTNALCNLVDNAIKYAKENPELTIQTFNRDGQLWVRVADKGPGISREYQQKVFDQFFRVPTGDVHDVKGFGLGLAYTRKIIELHGGTITLESEKGKGATFTISLPYA